MRKVVAKIVLTALACGTLAETACVLWTGKCSVDTGIELAVLWLVALGVSVVTAWKAINGTLIKVIYRTEYIEREPEDEEEPEEEEPEEEEE
jgi:hypothetical protein